MSDESPGPSDGAPAPPLDPMTALAEMAATVHTLFEAYKAAGFTDYQACVILGTWMATTGQGGSAS
jgi:hypothetical protein